VIEQLVMIGCLLTAWKPTDVQLLDAAKANHRLIDERINSTRTVYGMNYRCRNCGCKLECEGKITLYDGTERVIWTCPNCDSGHTN
jgi:lipopolysaccharide biosynthesis regulator YciM